MLKLIVSGRVGQDAQLKNINDTQVCSFSIAHTEKSKDGENTIWISCNVWGERAAKLAPHITKGTFIVAEGSGSIGLRESSTGATPFLNCRVVSLEFGGRPSTEVTNTTVSKSENNGELPF